MAVEVQPVKEFLETVRSSPRLWREDLREVMALVLGGSDVNDVLLLAGDVCLQIRPRYAGPMLFLAFPSTRGWH